MTEFTHFLRWCNFEGDLDKHSRSIKGFMFLALSLLQNAPGQNSLSDILQLQLRETGRSFRAAVYNGKGELVVVSTGSDRKTGVARLHVSIFDEHGINHDSYKDSVIAISNVDIALDKNGKVYVFFHKGLHNSEIARFSQSGQFEGTIYGPFPESVIGSFTNTDGNVVFLSRGSPSSLFSVDNARDRVTTTTTDMNLYSQDAQLVKLRSGRLGVFTREKGNIYVQSLSRVGSRLGEKRMIDGQNISKYKIKKVFSLRDGSSIDLFEAFRVEDRVYLLFSENGYTQLIEFDANLEPISSSVAPGTLRQVLLSDKFVDTIIVKPVWSVEEELLVPMFVGIGRGVIAIGN